MAAGSRPSEGRDFFEFLSGQSSAKMRPELADYRGGYDPTSGRNLATYQYQQQYQAGQDLGEQLRRRMAGEGPSVAELQMQRGGRQIDQAVRSQAASQRGVARNAARRDAIGALANARAQNNEAAAQLRAQEQQAAAGQYQNLIGMQQAGNLQNQGILSAEQTAQMQGDQNARMAAERFRAEQVAANQKAESDWFNNAFETVAGAMVRGSDRRLKEDVRRIDDDDLEREIARRLSSPEGNRRGLRDVQPYEYRYKPGAARQWGEDRGMRTGVMAQDLRESPYLRHTVVDTPNGLAVDQDRALSASLAANAGLDKRVGRLEDAIQRALAGR